MWTVTAGNITTYFMAAIQDFAPVVVELPKHSYAIYPAPRASIITKMPKPPFQRRLSRVHTCRHFK